MAYEDWINEVVSEFDNEHIAIRIRDINTYMPELWHKLKNRYGLTLGEYMHYKSYDRLKYYDRCVRRGNGYLLLFHEDELHGYYLYNFAEHNYTETIDDRDIDDILRSE